MATHSSILAWRIPWTEERGGATVLGVVFMCLFTWLQQVSVGMCGIFGVSCEIFSLWHMDSLVVARRLSCSTHVRSWFPD